MTSFLIKVLEGQSTLNSVLGPLRPNYSTQSLCVLIRDNFVYFLYGASPDKTIENFAPIECVIWRSDANRMARSDWRSIRPEQKREILGWLTLAKITALPSPDRDILFDVLCRLVETVNQPKRKERLTSEDIDKGLVDLGRKPASVKWVVNYVTGGLSFRGKGEDSSTETLEYYLDSILLQKDPMEDASHLFDGIDVDY